MMGLLNCCYCKHSYRRNKGSCRDIIGICKDYDKFEPIDKSQLSNCKYKQIGKEIGKLVDKKQVAYGNSFGKSGEFLSLLYPNGVKPEQYGDALTIVRIFDKLMRIATAKDAFGEDPYRDIAGYVLLAIGKDSE